MKRLRPAQYIPRAIFCVALLSLSVICSGCLPQFPGMTSRDVRSPSPAATPPPSFPMVVSEALNVRTCPQSSCTRIGVLYKGTQVAVAQQQQGWSRITLPSRHQQTWVASRYLVSPRRFATTQISPPPSVPAPVPEPASTAAATSTPAPLPAAKKDIISHVIETNPLPPLPREELILSGEGDQLITIILPLE